MKCGNCQKFFNPQSLSGHTRGCRFLEESEKAFKCKICQFQSNGKSKISVQSIYGHLEEKHQNLLNSGKSPCDSQSITDVEILKDVPKSNFEPKSDAKIKESKGIQCQHCLKFIRKCGIQAHVKSCKMYFKFLERTETMFKCKICPFQSKISNTPSLIYSHIRSYHQDLINLQENSDKGSELTGKMYFHLPYPRH